MFGRIVPDGRIRVFDRLVSIASFPGRHRRGGLRQGQARGRLGAGAAAVNRIIGIDRLDYTKGLPQKFKAFGRFLDKYPQYRGRSC